MATNFLPKNRLFLALASACFLTSFQYSTFAYGSDTTELVCSIPVGGKRGVHYEGVGVKDALPWGPKSFTIDQDGNFIIADTAANRLLQYSSSCKYLRSIPLPETLVGATDIKISQGSIWVLDSASPTPSVYQLMFSGDVLDTFQIPKNLSDDLTGLSIGDNGDVLGEMSFGESTVNISQIEGVSRQGISYIANISNGLGEVAIGNKRFPVTVDGKLIGLHILHVTNDNRIFVVVDESNQELYQTIRQYTSDGSVEKISRIPTDGFIDIDHNLSVNNENGEIYTIVAYPKRFEIRKLIFVDHLNSLKNNTIENIVLEKNISPSSKAVSCKIFRPDVISNAQAFINNSSPLDDVNISGECPGRGKPRYLTTADFYSSVPYDWGGFSSIKSFNDDMASGLQAGDIDTKGVEICSKGVDCSGFVSRAWNLPTKRGTGQLSAISYNVGNIGSVDSLRRGDILNLSNHHVMLFESVSGNTATVYEATTDANVDRVVHHNRTLSYIKKKNYTPLRYNAMCDYVDGQVGCSGLSAALFYNNMEFNFGGGKFSKDADGNDYNGIPLYFNAKSNYDRTSKSLSIDLAIYKDSGHTQHVRTDRCIGTWDDSKSTNLFDATCTLIRDTSAGCPTLWVQMAIDETGGSSASKVQNGAHIEQKDIVNTIYRHN
ncbi:hypothetical protein [Thiobaca trueperi]|uniref:NlpC/P60 domain-containing protein n=1 Tax=Thiobaca trueperi TaxID=127458 RepID=A0A4R3N0J1_9GAMM|nr:hypothetical protein [Thiobaca trueperi]TCT22214.1 hypothetical protein EDC35_103313 [Thiobaca trueperi]